MFVRAVVIPGGASYEDGNFDFDDIDPFVALLSG